MNKFLAGCPLWFWDWRATPNDLICYFSEHFSSHWHYIISAQAISIKFWYPLEYFFFILMLSWCIFCRWNFLPTKELCCLITKTQSLLVFDIIPSDYSLLMSPRELENLCRTMKFNSWSKESSRCQQLCYKVVDPSFITPQIHSKGMMVISHLKPWGSKWKWHKHLSWNWKFPIIKFLFRIVD